MSQSPILKIEQLGHRYPGMATGRWVLEGISLSVEPGQVAVIRGASGQGKTTLLLACGGMRPPTTGDVWIRGTNFYQQAARQRQQLRARHIGYLFQSLELLPYLTLKENVCLGRGVRSGVAMTELVRLGLEEWIDSKPQNVSHGQCQRAALVRAMAHQPDLLIADEPTGNLDRRNSEMVFHALRQFADAGHAVLLATHDEGADRIADWTLNLDSASSQAAGR